MFVIQEKNLNDYPTIEEYRKIIPNKGKIQGGLIFLNNYIKKSEANNPLVSIITIVKNNEKNIERTIQSVFSQTYKNIEYIIIDGGSTDKTIEIIKKYEDRIDRWISEPDQGVSDAFNKGIALSTGDIIGILNSDDWYMRDHISLAVGKLNNADFDFVFGDMLYFDKDGNKKFLIKGDPDYKNIIESRMPAICHPTVLVKRRVYEKYGLFNIHYKFAMDYEWFLRLHKSGSRGLYVSGLIGHMTLSGLSDKYYIESLIEVKDISIKYGKNRLLAECLFICRIIKGFTKCVLEMYLPETVYKWMRELMNKDYRSIEKDENSDF